MALIKILSWKHKGWKALLGYIHKDQISLHGIEPFTIFHNAPPTIPGAYEAFKENEMYRNKKIRKGTVLSHHILSLHPQSKEYITMDKLFDIATYYTSHFEDSIVVAHPHTDRENVHIHFVISHNKVRSVETCRMSKQELVQLKTNVQDRILTKYPELEASRINHTRISQRAQRYKSAKGKDQKELHMIERLGGREYTNKHIIKNLVQTCFHTSDSVPEFIEQLHSNNLQTYSYRGKLRGVLCGGRKWTLSRSCELGTEYEAELKERGKEIERRTELLRAVTDTRDDKALIRELNMFNHKY